LDASGRTRRHRDRQWQQQQRLTGALPLLPLLEIGGGREGVTFDHSTFLSFLSCLFVTGPGKGMGVLALFHFSLRNCPTHIYIHFPFPFLSFFAQIVSLTSGCDHPTIDALMMHHMQYTASTPRLFRFLVYFLLSLLSLSFCFVA